MAGRELLELRVFYNQLVAVAEEMGETLMRTAFSPNIKERRDFSCAVFDDEGRLIAQASHIPVHLGAMPLAVRTVRHSFAGVGWVEGDVVALNDPYSGGTHLPDLTMVSPVFGARRRLLGFVASRAHQADIGGMSPGSMPLATELFQEGVIVPPIKLVAAGQWNEAALALLLRNVRTPLERRGDLDAQIAAHRVGERGLRGLRQRYAARAYRGHLTRLLEYTERVTRAAIRQIPAGSYTFRDELDDDGFDARHLGIAVTLTVTAEGELTADFTGTAAETAGPVNAVEAVTAAAVYYCVRCLAPHDMPANEGALRPITVIAPEGTLANARPPRAVCGGNVETSQRLTDAVFGALAKALPRRIPAASQGTMNNLTLGGVDHRSGLPYAYYETIGGGCGAGPQGNGLSGVHVHMSNTLNTPVEALELAYPFRVVEYALRKHSGGAGHHRGGDGLRRVIRLQGRAAATIISERRARGPWGLAGGQDGVPGRNWLRSGGSTEELPGKVAVNLQAGDVLSIETPGGGGWGAAGP
jgi:N-methylhydantoinase B